MPAASTPAPVFAGVLSWRVLINGQPASSSGLDLVSITINQAVHAPGTATLVLFAANPVAREVPFSEVKALMPGTRVEVAAGYDQALHVLFQGTVVEVGISRQGEQEPLVTVSCSDAATPTAARRPAVANGKLALTIENGVSLDDFCLQLDAQAAVTGTVLLRGSHRPQPGSTVLLRGLGTHFNGLAQVGCVRHTLAEGDWMTRLSLSAVRPPVAEPHPLAAPAVFLGLCLLGAVAYAWVRRRPKWSA